MHLAKNLTVNKGDRKQMPRNYSTISSGQTEQGIQARRETAGSDALSTVAGITKSRSTTRSKTCPRPTASTSGERTSLYNCRVHLLAQFGTFLMSTSIRGSLLQITLSSALPVKTLKTYPNSKRWITHHIV